MDEKIKKLAFKVEGLVKYFGTPQDTYDDLVKVAKIRIHPVNES